MGPQFKNSKTNPSWTRPPKTRGRKQTADGRFYTWVGQQRGQRTMLKSFKSDESERRTNAYELRPRRFEQDSTYVEHDRMVNEVHDVVNDGIRK